MSGALLRECRVALNDWVRSYAPEMCGEDYVAETRQRINEGGGTLAYIGDLLARIDAHLAAGSGEGWVSVPVEPTEEMLSELASVGGCIYDVLPAYKAMLKAAPQEKK